RMSPRQVLDCGRAAFTDLRPAGDDDEVHHARPGGHVAVDDLVAIRVRVEVRLGPDPGELLLDPIDARGAGAPAHLLRGGSDGHASALIFDATFVPRGTAFGRPPQGPSCRLRSWGSRAPARWPTSR